MFLLITNTALPNGFLFSLKISPMFFRSGNSFPIVALTWTASAGHCSTLYQKREASWRLYESCDQSLLPLYSEEVSLVFLAPLEKRQIMNLLLHSSLMCLEYAVKLFREQK